MIHAYRLIYGLLLFGLFQSAAFATEPEEPLPKITPEFISEIQRLAMTLRLAEFPLTQQEYRKHLELPRFVMGLGIPGRGIRDHQVCILSDPTDPLGHYGFHIYWGPRQPGPADLPVIEQIELFFKPGNQGHYPPVRAFVLTKDPLDQLYLDSQRKKMRELKLTPGAYVRNYYAEWRQVREQ